MTGPDLLPESQWEELVRLRAAVARVEAIHRAITDDDLDGPGLGYLPDGSYGSIDPACLSCGQLDEYAVPCPCATIKALRGES